MNVQLSRTTVARLSRPVRGRGGFQSLLRRIQPRLVGRTIDLDEGELEKLGRYSRSYGRGGFQDRTTGAADDAQLGFDFG